MSSDQYDYICKTNVSPIVNDDILRTVYSSLVLLHMESTYIVRDTTIIMTLTMMAIT